MARTALATQTATCAGLEATFSAANADGHYVAGGGDVLLEVVNGGGSDITVTIQTPGTVSGLAVADQTVTVTAGERRHIRLGPSSTFDQPSGATYAGSVLVDFSAVTSVTVAAIVQG